MDKKKKLTSILFCLLLLIMVSMVGIYSPDVKGSFQNASNESEEASVSMGNEDETAGDEEKEEDTPVIGFWGYTGYLDECNSSSAEEFKNCDYDGDGMNDRIYRWNVEDQGDGNDTRYRIEFGNGEELILERAVPDSGFPYLIAADFSQNGKNEIVFGCTYWTSTNPMAFGELAVFQKTEDGYGQIQLPMELSDSAYTMTLDFNYQKVKEKLIRVTCADTGFLEDIEIEDVLWEQQGYKDYFTSATNSACVWRAEVVEGKGGIPELKCYFSLFDKWSVCEVSLLLRYQDDRFVSDGMELVKNNA